MSRNQMISEIENLSKMKINSKLSQIDLYLNSS
jgi:hypothetical protein